MPNSDVWEFLDVVVPPFPALAMNIIVREPMKTLHVTEVHEREEFIIGGALAIAEPIRRAQESISVFLRFCCRVDFLTYMRKVCSARGKDAKRTGRKQESIRIVPQ